MFTSRFPKKILLNKKRNKKPFSDLSSPTLQMAFAYYVLEERSDNRLPLLQKRLRLLTLQIGIANSAKDVFDGAEAAPSLSLLSHKVAHKRKKKAN